MSCTREAGVISILALGLLVASATAAPAGAVPPELPAAVQWRGLLQADGNGGSGVKTAVIFNLNTKGQPVFCINVTKPFSDTSYSAGGSEKPSGGDIDALAQQICADFQAAGAQLFDQIQAGGDQAKAAAQAVKQASCSDPNFVPNAVTVASIQAQQTLGSLSEVEGYFQKWIEALQAVGVSACITVVESDSSGERVADEKYFKTT
ncbi:hypothetical protein COHA_004028 [Chlorella ohadii]|uniref:Uncharacterized protein n=1 Tax=Chlorella ohadii TaxID=2649997 RepID=A0AAD5H306_9CHLO|nr:hypothetical protein COHA_004028 [Chlorella ohadii]